MQNMTVLWLLMTGTTAAASSDVQPMTRERLGVRARRLPTAGFASAGSPLVSAEVQLTVWPRIPPALFIAFAVPSQDTRYVGPSAASGPLNGATSANTIEPFEPLDEFELPHAARPPASATAATAASARAVRPRRTPVTRARRRCPAALAAGSVELTIFVASAVFRWMSR